MRCEKRCLASAPVMQNVLKSSSSIRRRSAIPRSSPILSYLALPSIPFHQPPNSSMRMQAAAIRSSKGQALCWNCDEHSTNRMSLACLRQVFCSLSDSWGPSFNASRELMSTYRLRLGRSGATSYPQFGSRPTDSEILAGRCRR